MRACLGGWTCHEGLVESFQCGLKGDGGRTWLLTFSSATGGVAQLVERLTGSQEVRGFKSLRLHFVVQNDNVRVVPFSLQLTGSHVAEPVQCRWFPCRH